MKRKTVALSIVLNLTFWGLAHAETITPSGVICKTLADLETVKDAAGKLDSSQLKLLWEKMKSESRCLYAGEGINRVIFYPSEKISSASQTNKEKILTQIVWKGHIGDEKGPTRYTFWTIEK